jgi:pyochelin synthetase
VRAAVVTVTGKQHNQERLVAHIVPEPQATPTVEELRDFLSHKLPEQMIPSVFSFWQTFPLSANGKVDRQALTIPEGLVQDFQVTYVAPQNELEQTITHVWQEVLDLEKVGVNDKFFEVGGNSLLLTTTYGKLKKVLPNEIQSISIVDLFKYSTIRSLAQYLSNCQLSSLKQQTAESDQELKAGKNRLLQRYKKSLIG